MTVAVVLVSAGKGTRLGANMPKAAVTVAGQSLLEVALSRIAQFQPDELIVVAPSELLADFEKQTAKYFDHFKVVAGGDTRQKSVQAGLEHVTTDLVLIHDAARAFAPSEVFSRVRQALESAPAAIPVLQISDTVKQVSVDHVEQTLDRQNLRLSQTPQGFEVAGLRAALSQANSDFTDEAALMESLGNRILIVEGHEHGFKITTPSDLERARAIFSDFRTGVGVDAHQFDTQGELVLGCLVWPEYPKLVGHSDGDSVAHAIVDALFSAAGLGDIGTNFGTSRPEFAGASGELFIRTTIKILAEQGFEPTNISVQIVGDVPKIAPRRLELEERLTDLVGAPVSVLATTTDGLGFLADSKGVAAVATSLVQKRG